MSLLLLKQQLKLAPSDRRCMDAATLRFKVDAATLWMQLHCVLRWMQLHCGCSYTAF